VWVARWPYSTPAAPLDASLVRVDQNKTDPLVFSGEFGRATGFAFDSVGNLYVGSLDGTDHPVPQPPERQDAIRKYDPNGNLLLRFGSDPLHDGLGQDIVITSDDRIFAIHGNPYNIIEFTTTGEKVRSAEAFDGKNRFGAALAISRDGQFLYSYVPTNGGPLNDHKIVTYDLSLNVLATFEPGFCAANVVCDPLRQIVTIYGRPLGLKTTPNGDLVATDATGTVFVLSSANGDLVRTFQLRGLVPEVQGFYLRHFVVSANGDIIVVQNHEATGASHQR
jgi:hypothetical protein